VSARGGRAGSEKILETLALLRDLGVPEAARGLLPLLLDPDARVRALVRDAVTASRGFSLAKDLERLLDRALETSAPPDAVRELVELLERTGGEDALVALGRALRCEERSVWEAVVSAARVHASDAHAGRMGELLAADPPLPASLLTIAIGEVERARRKEFLPALEKLARGAQAETVRRKALEAALALAADVTPLATDVLARSLARVKELSKEKAKKKSDTSRELSRQRATVTTAARIALRSHEDLGKALSLLPEEALRPLVANEALDRAAVVAAAGPLPSSLRGALKRLPRDPLGDLAWRVRDRVTDFASKLDDLAPAERDRFALAEVTARLLGPELALAWHEKMARDARLERLYLAAIEHLKPDLAPIFPVLVETVKRTFGSGAPAISTVERLARAKLRLGIKTGTDAIVAFARGAVPGVLDDDASSEVSFRQRYLAAEGLVSRLVAELDQKTSDKKVLIPLLGEVGGPEAIRAIQRFARDESHLIRAAVTRALLLAGVVPKEQLKDAAEDVLVVALDATGRLGAREQAGEVLRLLGHTSLNVQGAAAGAAVRLGLAEARPALERLLSLQALPPETPGALPSRAARSQAMARALAAARALEVIGDAASAPGLLEALHAGVGAPVREVIERTLARIVPDERLDEVGALLGARNAEAAIAALHVLGQRGVTRALPAVRQLVAHAQLPVRDAAIETAVALGDRAVVPLLRKFLEKEPNDTAARAGLLAFEPPSADELFERVAGRSDLVAFAALAARDEEKAARAALLFFEKVMAAVKRGLNVFSVAGGPTLPMHKVLAALAPWIRAHPVDWVPRIDEMAGCSGNPGLELLAELAPAKAARRAALALRVRRVPGPSKPRFIRMLARAGRLADVREALLEPEPEARIEARRVLEPGRFAWEEREAP
jgi:HEAT repeat protein